VTSLLDVLSPEDREHFIEVAVPHTYRRGEIVFHEGTPSHRLHLIKEGRVAVRVATIKGDTATLSVLGVGDCFGELTMTEPHTVRSATIMALEEVATISIGRVDLNDMRTNQPTVDRFLIAVLAKLVKRLSAQVVEALYMPAEQRLTHRLAELASIYDDGTQPIAIPLTQAHIATMAGTTRPTANQVLKSLETAGIVRVLRGRIDVLDPGALA
jgi:CRP/FNR family cyclic AMP-dependent transcriptional regulator